MDNNNLVEELKSICRKMAIKKELFTLIERAQMGDNLQICVLYDIIKIWLLFNYL